LTFRAKSIIEKAPTLRRIAPSDKNGTAPFCYNLVKEKRAVPFCLPGFFLLKKFPKKK